MLNYRRDVWAHFPRLVHLVRPPQHTESAPLAGLLAASAAVCLLSSKDTGPLNAGSMVGGVGGSALHQLVELVRGQQSRPHIVHVHEALQEGQQVEELRIGLVIVPAFNGNAIGELVTEGLLNTPRRLRACPDMLPAPKFWHADYISGA